MTTPVIADFRLPIANLEAEQFTNRKLEIESWQ